MSTEPTVTEADLQAYADGRLGVERRAEVESWLAARPEEAERVAAYRRLGDALRAAYDPVLAEPVPQYLESTAARRPRARRIAAVAGWMTLGALLGALVKFIPVLSDEKWEGRMGFVHRAVMEDFPDMSGVQVYACGAPIVIESARRDFSEQCRLPAEEFYADSFLTEADKALTP